MRLFDLIQAEDYTSVAVMGMAKNTGKTVTLNQIIEEASEVDYPLGLTSIGRDGERMDIVTQTVKPAIFAPAGTLLATAQGSLPAATARLEVLRNTDITTPLGDIVIARVRESGNVEIAGADSNANILATMRMMEALGAKLVLVDGALDRITPASPGITEAVVLATGAALARDMEKVVERTAHTVEMLKLPAVSDNDIANLAGEIIEKRQIGIVRQEEGGSLSMEVLPLRTALLAGREIGAALTMHRANAVAVVFGGALSVSVLKDVMASHADLTGVPFIVNDGTRVFLPPLEYRIFLRRGGSLQVLSPINLLAVTVNSWSPKGRCFDADEFLDRIGAAVHPIPVFDNYLCRSACTPIKVG